MTWPTYPRVPHLAPGPGVTRDDLVLTEEACKSLLNGAVRVEEKLDGANMSFAICRDGRLELSTRGGVGAVDRGGHLGRARAWAAERSDQLRALLADGCVLYGEWLLTRHGVGYNRLPDLFVAFDLFDPKTGWANVRERDTRLRGARLSVPPLIGEFDGIDVAGVDMLMRASEFGAPSVEGVVVRALGSRAGAPRLAKRLAEDLPRIADDAFGGARVENHLSRTASRA